MYHYIRKKSESYPNLKFLDFHKFKKQISKFENESLITTNFDDNLRNKTVLTFDDGLKDHLSVAEYLNKKKIKRNFFCFNFTVVG